MIGALARRSIEETAPRTRLWLLATLGTKYSRECRGSSGLIA